MILSIGEILFDLFPDYERIGGAPFNFAVHLKNLGTRVRFFSRIGNDVHGTRILRKIKYHTLDAKDIQPDSEHPTGKVIIRLDKNGTPDFKILSDTAFDYISSETVKNSCDIKDAELIYFGTLIQRTQYGSNSLKHLLSQVSGSTIKFCDINLRPHCFTEKTVRESLAYADVIKLNRQELLALKKITSYYGSDREVIKQLSEKYEIKTIAVTNGAEESILFTDNIFYTAAPPHLDIITDTVGAGDAFAAVLANGLIKKLPPAHILHTANKLASAVCGIMGAIPDSPDVYQDLKM